MDDMLLCDEVWPTSPLTPENKHACKKDSAESCIRPNFISMLATKEDCDKALRICLDKEPRHLPQPGYLDCLMSSEFIRIARFKAIHWLIKSKRRLNFSMETLFNAANYLDRFLSANQCHEWEYWMVELLTVACLSIASKFGETNPPPLHEIQMQDLDHTFQSSLIHRMELNVLKNLEWQLGSTTAYSFAELLTWNIEFLKPLLLEELTARISLLLMGSLLDYKFIAFRPCTIAISALSCILEGLFPSASDDHLASLTTSFSPQGYKDDINKCSKMMVENLLDGFHNIKVVPGSEYPIACSSPSSPVTVLKNNMDHADAYDYQCQLNFCLFNAPAALNINPKPTAARKRERGE